TMEKTMEHRILSEHFNKVKNKLLEYSKHFDIAKHGDMKGYGREALVNEFLKTHLPDQIEYLTGEIIDEKDSRSGQVDIILQAKHCAKIPLLGSTHLVFSDAVIAAIEVKSNLNLQHLRKALDGFVKIKQQQRQDVIKGNKNCPDLKRTPCILIAFQGMKAETLIGHINKYAKENKVSLDLCSPDVVVVLDSSYYVCRNDGWIFPKVPVPNAFFRTWDGLPHENLVGLYIYLTNLCTSTLIHPPLFDIAPYFDKSVLKK
ncbi:DUF6602 domain-containing protein, partial [Vibrio vulnificus]